MKHFKILSLILITLIVSFSCSNDSETPNPQPQTIADIAAADENFSTLVSALDRAGLLPIVSGTGNYTVFAPTNDAFNSLGVDLNSIDDETLRGILLYHVLGIEVMSSDIALGQTYVSTAATIGPNETALSMLVDKGDAVTINGSAKVITADIDASNGVIHVVNAVIMPLDVVGHALANPNLSQLAGALNSASLVGALQADGPYTVFAPLNAAFEAISGVVSELSVEQLTNILTYHVVGSANVLSTELSDGQVVTALNNGSFKIKLGSTADIIDANDNIVTIVLTDIQATNGVIHVVDAVLLP